MPSAANIRPGGFVIQKYMEVPLLIDRRKFDIRVWVLVTQEGRAYFFKEGYLRTSSEEYNLLANDITKDSIHLTNNAVQKNMENYGKYEEGNILAFHTSRRVLTSLSVPLSMTTWLLDGASDKELDSSKSGGCARQARHRKGLLRAFRLRLPG